MINGMSKIKVSILCLTYNHEKYIKKCIDSFLMQETKFEFEILIHDDASTDGTQEIIKNYKKMYPKIIKPIYQKENQFSKGVRPTVKYQLPRVKGEYIALCEGDDYWTDTSKLQRQVDFLDKHKDYSLCFHPVCIMHEGGEVKETIFPDGKPELSIRALLRGNYIQTNSVMYRRQGYKNFATDVMPGDWYMHLYHAQFGKIGYINKVMSVYRRHSGGLWSGIRDNQEVFWSRFGYVQLMFFFRMLEMYGKNSEYKEIICRHIAGKVDEMFEYTNIGESVIAKLSDKNKKYPGIIIKEQAKQLRDLRREPRSLGETVAELHEIIENKEKEIKDIKSSRIWKLRNQAARFIGRKRV